MQSLAEGARATAVAGCGEALDDASGPYLHAVVQGFLTSDTFARQPLVIFDGDDTLWLVEQLYDEARRRAAVIVAEAGLSAFEWERLERKIDVRTVAEMGMHAARFPTSCVQAYQLVAAAANAVGSRKVASDIYAAALFASSTKAPLVEGANEVLAAMADRSELVLLTQGDPIVQHRRVQESGLGRFFGDKVFIAPHKTASEFRLILNARRRADARDAWSVGNSLASDINPALCCGMRAIWIDAPVWDYERRETVPAGEGVIAIQRLSEVPGIFGSQHSGHPILASR
jgi:putative hydrolase of the HAD superfamily